MDKSGNLPNRYLVYWIILLLIGAMAGGCRKKVYRRAICDIQGPGLASPVLDQEVVLSGLVIADLEDTDPGGYLILDEDCPLSGERSRGIYISIQEGKGPIDLGDKIRVEGIVREIEGETRLVVNPQGLEILSLNNSVPAPVDLGQSLRPPLIFGYEKWEGQLVAIPQADIVEGSAASGRIRVLPQRSADPSVQLICFQEDDFILEIDESLLASSLNVYHFSSGMENLVGLIRQDQDSYFIQLIQEPAVGKDQVGLQNTRASSTAPARELTQTSPKTSFGSSTPSMTPLPSSSATPTLRPTPRPTIIPSPTYYPVRLLITEILPNPPGEEPEGEWIEIYNPSGGRLPLMGIKIGDALSPSGKEGLLGFPDGFFIQEGQVLVIANQARTFISRQGFLPDFEMVNSDPRVPNLVPYNRWGGNVIKLSNSGDEVLLVDPWDQIVDLVAYGSSSQLAAPAEGHSLSYFPSDQGGEWHVSLSPSPGRLVFAQPTQPANRVVSPTTTTTLSLTSTDLTPTTTSLTPTSTMNTTSVPINTPFASETSTPEPTLSELPSYTSTQRPSETGSATPSPSLTTSTTPSATHTPDLIGTLSITPALTETEIPSITYAPEISPTLGQTLTTTSTLVSATETPFNTSTSPSILTPTPTIGALLIINEILADPDPILGDSNRDGVINSDDDEFLELVNISEQALDLSGWRVSDAVRLRYTFPAGTSLKSGCGLVIFGGGDPKGDFGGSLVYTAGSLGLNNGGDLITVTDLTGTEMILVLYGLEGNQDQSLTRYPDLLGQLPLVLHSQAPGAAGALYSPGTRIDQTAFGSCP